MKQNTKQAFSIFVILLITTQEFCIAAKYHPKALQKIKSVAEDDVANFGEIAPRRREKRALATILFGVALFASLANVAFDIYLQIEGCCGLYPDACTYRDNFEIIRDNIVNASSLIDDNWLLSQNLLTYLETSSLRNEEIALEIERITQSYDAIIESADPSIISYYTNLTAELELAIAENNATVLAWTDYDIDLAFTSAFDSVLGTIGAVGGILGPIATKTLGFAFSYYKVSKIQTFLRTTYGAQLNNVNNAKALSRFTSGNADDLISETAKVQHAVNQANSRATTIFNVASSVLSLVKIGVEIYIAIQKIEQCKDIRDEAKEAYDAIADDEDDVEELYEDVVEYYANVTATYESVVDQLKDDDFLSYIEAIKNLTDAASTTTSLVGVSTDLQSFIDTIGSTTDAASILVKQDELIESLEQVTFTLDCYEKKVRTLTILSTRCAAGEGDLQDLYDTAVVDFETNSDACTNDAGLTYTEYADAVSYIASQATTNNYQTDCILNDANMLALVCSEECDGHDDASIASTTGLTTAYVTLYKALCPQYCELTPNRKTEICNYKTYGIPVSVLLSLYTAYDPTEVEDYYNNDC